MRTPALLLLALLTGCRSGARSKPAPGALAIRDTITKPADGLLGAPLRLAVAPDGRLFVIDAVNAQVVVFDTLGHLLQKFARAGNGPGELVRPTSISASAESLWVADGGRDEVAVFTADGRYVRSMHNVPWLAVAEIAVNRSGEGLLAQHGRDTALARRVDRTGALGAKLGKPVALPDFAFDFKADKRALAAGEIPQAFLSYSSPAIAVDGSAWVLRIVAGTIERYSPRDSLLWTAELPDTMLARLRAGLAERTRRDTTPAGFAFPNALVAGAPVGDTLWVLLQGGEETTTIGRLLPTGAWASWIEVDGTGQIAAFAIDPARHRLYLLDRLQGTIVRVELPAVSGAT